MKFLCEHKQNEMFAEESVHELAGKAFRAHLVERENLEYFKISRSLNLFSRNPFGYQNY